MLVFASVVENNCCTFVIFISTSAIHACGDREAAWRVELLHSSRSFHLLSCHLNALRLFSLDLILFLSSLHYLVIWLTHFFHPSLCLWVPNKVPSEVSEVSPSNLKNCRTEVILLIFLTLVAFPRPYFFFPLVPNINFFVPKKLPGFVYHIQKISFCKRTGNTFHAPLIWISILEILAISWNGF